MAILSSLPIEIIVLLAAAAVALLAFYLGTRFLCLLYTSPSPRDATLSRMPSSA